MGLGDRSSAVVVGQPLKADIRLASVGAGTRWGKWICHVEFLFAFLSSVGYGYTKFVHGFFFFSFRSKFLSELFSECLLFVPSFFFVPSFLFVRVSFVCRG